MYISTNNLVILHKSYNNGFTLPHSLLNNLIMYIISLTKNNKLIMSYTFFNNYK